MTRDEADLRAALHRGEGAAPDADAVLAAARLRSARRHTRVLASVGAAVVVVAVAVTAGVLAHSSSSGDGNGSGPGAGRPAGATAGSSVGAPARGANSGGYTVTAGCPSSPTPTVTSTGPEEPAAKSGADLFPAGVVGVLVCGYGSSGSGPSSQPGSRILSGATARTLVTSVNSADATRPAICNDLRVAADHRYAFVGVTPSGPTAPVYVTLGNPTCSVVLTNGATSRYNWQPPDDVAVAIAGVGPR